MAKRVILQQTPSQSLTTILEKLRDAGVNAPAGGSVDAVAIILVEDADVSRALYILTKLGIEVRTA